MSRTRDRLAAALQDRYTIERELGAGGMATVYLADDLKHDRKVALKVLKPELAAVVGAERFLAEIKTTANLQHPHILPLFDSGEADGFLYYVMPFVEGETLRDRLDREKQLPVHEAVRIANETADALGHAHSKGVIHRDIKPANILLRDGRVQVADFGIALAVQHAGGSRLTETGLSVGTPHYMSPEQASGDRELDGRSDLYSLGCVLYEMLAGEPPHTGPTAQAILSKILTEEPKALGQIRHRVPPHIEAAVKTALEKLPADRFESAKALVDALGDSFFRGLSASQADERGDRRRPSELAQQLLIGVALLAVVLAGWGWLRPWGEEGGRQVLHLPLSLFEPPRGRNAGFYSTGVELTPGGGEIAYQGVVGGWWLRDLGEDTSRPLGFRSHAVAFSPSGDSLAYAEGGYLQQVYVVDLATSRSTLIADSVTGQLAWNDDGWIYSTDISGVIRVRINDGRKEVLARPDHPSQWYARVPTPISSGRGVLYTRVPLAPRDPASAEIVVLDLLSGESRVLTNGVEGLISPSGHLLVAQIDGSLLAGRFDVPSLERRGPLVKIMEGLEIRKTYGVGAAFGVSADGTLLYVKDRPLPGDSVVFVGRNGQVEGIGPNWGGSVRQVAYRERDALWTASVQLGRTVPDVFVTKENGGEPRRLTFWEIVHYYPRFIPGSDDISFVAPRVGGKNWDLYRVPFDGGGAPVLIVDRPGDIRFPRFTEDGRWVVFCEVSHTGQRDVLAHRFDADSATVVLAATDAQECDPDVSPDARWLAYTSDHSGRNEVWVRPFDQNLTTRWQVSTEGGSAPRWSRTGGELFYLSAEDEIIAVPLLDEVSFEWGPHQVLFALDERSSWTGETSADGEQFILVRGQREASGQVMMVRNFFDLLNKLVGQP